MKKQIHQIKAQRGFFDFGLAVFILASGTTAGVVKTSLNETEIENTKVAVEKQSDVVYPIGKDGKIDID